MRVHLNTAERETPRLAAASSAKRASDFPPTPENSNVLRAGTSRAPLIANPRTQDALLRDRIEEITAHRGKVSQGLGPVNPSKSQRTFRIWLCRSLRDW